MSISIYMRTIIALSFFFSLYAYSQTQQENKLAQDYAQKAKLDYGDKQLLMRDACRKPIEYLETKYDNIPKEELQKLQKRCGNN